MKRIRIILTIILVFLFKVVGAQTSPLDSLFSELHKYSLPVKHISDTSRINLLMEIGYIYQNTNPDSALFYHSEAVEMSVDIMSQEQLTKLELAKVELKKGQAIRNQGWDCFLKGDYEKALAFYSAVVQIAEKYIQQNLNKEIKREGQDLYSAVAGNIGVVYRNQGNYPKALENYFIALSLNEELADENGQAVNLGNIGVVYLILGDYPSALDYFFRALKLNKKLNDKSGRSTNLGNIGIVYNTQGNYDSALFYFSQALEMSIVLDDKSGQACHLGNTGGVYHNLGDYQQALHYYLMALKLTEEFGNKRALASILANIGELNISLKKYKEAETFLIKGLELSIEMGALDLMKDFYLRFSELYEETNRPALALEKYKLYIVYRDSIFNEEATKLNLEKEIQFTFDKKTAEDSVAFAKQDEINNAEIAKQDAELKAKKNQQYALVAGLLFVLVLTGFIYNRFIISQNQKRIIETQKVEVENQKHLIDEKQKEIIDSITYAKRIQDAILPPQKLVEKYLRDSFILYLPKDIVAGDFYWFEVVKGNRSSVSSSINDADVAGEISDLTLDKKQPASRGEQPTATAAKEIATANCVLFAAADCTGHGVPGALVSVVCSNALNRTVNEFNITEPGKILDKVRELVIETFEKSESEVKDGMDISLCALTPFSLGEGPGMRLEWSGANNPLWIIKKVSNELIEIKANALAETSNKYQLIEVKADKQPIGKYAEPKPFTTHKMDLQKGDSIYIFTDGFQDQFGGEKGKKFKASAMKDLLLSIQEKSLNEQREILETAFGKWRGQLEQIDDVCVIGVKI